MLPLLAFVLAQPAPMSDETKAALAFLKTHQLPSGGFVTKLPAKGAEPVPSLRTTRTAIRAHRLLGAAAPNPDKVVEFVMACYDAKSGGFADRPGEKPDPISTSVALMILQELKKPTDKYLEPALQFMGEKTSGFEQIRMVASGLEETGKTVPQQKGWLKEIDAARNKDGSYGKGPGLARTTALNVVAQQRLGGKPGEASSLHGTYYAAILRHWLAGGK